MKHLAVGATLLFAISSLNATNYYISNSGSDFNNGTSPGTAFQTIQNATNIVVAGDCVLVADGRYTGFNQLSLNSGTLAKPIVYKAVGKNVIIVTKSAHASNAINIENCDYIHVIGFNASGMMKYGIVWNTFGIRIVNSLHSVLRYNVCDSDGIGIMTAYCTALTIEHNRCCYSALQHGIYHANCGDSAIVRYNYCAYNLSGAGIQFNPDVSQQDFPNPGTNTGSIISYNILHHNHIGLNTQGLIDCIISDNLIYDFVNTGITFYHAESSAGTTGTKVFNNTVVANTSGRWNIFLQNEVTNLQIYNNILINIPGASGSICFNDGATAKSFTSNYNIVSDDFCDVDYNCSEPLSYWKGLGYDANSILAPASLTSLFVDAANGDYHLVNGAIAINAGTNLVSSNVTQDLDGLVSPYGNGYDIGCYEYNSVPSGIQSFATSKKNILVLNGSNACIKDTDPSDKISFYDVLGNLVYFGNNWNYSMQPGGVYMYSCVSEKNNTRSSDKFIINTR